MSLRLKNDWKYVGEDRWDWDVYLVSDNPAELEKVEDVKYVLHPTFSNPVRVVKNRQEGFRLRTNGWGTFLITAFVRFKSGDKVKLEHELDLNYNPESGSSP